MTGVMALLTLGLLNPVPAWAGADARAQFNTFARALHSLSGQFSQRSVDMNGRVGRLVHGTIALAKPRRFRWQITAPYPQTIVADGHKIWVYDPQLEQVSVRDQSHAEAHSPLSVLTDPGLLGKTYKLVEEGSRDGLQWLRLRPKTRHAQFKYAELGFADNELRVMRFEDLLGDQTTIRFSHWQRNPVLPAQTFRFVPPPGTDIVGTAASTLQTYPIQH
ncbi:MAG TPA: outer membrane lipoprotein carrier protein LolA [Mizugakiibacter sp.]|nr:outer membrane lipoprotein carrier protein LolA [Mizugakiibacter sp.]